MPQENPSQAPILQTADLTRRFGDLTAVDKLNITVAAGESFGLLGPNGAGKTTAIKMLTTMLPPTAGEGEVAGFSIRHAANEVRRVIGYVPQMLSADANLTGYENLSVFAGLYNVPSAERRPRINEALHFMGLEEAAGRLVRTYSGGMIRRLEIAQSILHRPRVIFLDEPTVGLDPVARKAVWGHITELCRRYGTTILMSTHFMDEADSLCDRVAIMHHGRVVAMDSPESLKAAIGPGASLEDVFIRHTVTALIPWRTIVIPLELEKRQAPRLAGVAS
jgi:ABC-2 type transport system ATP-binding protein